MQSFELRFGSDQLAILSPIALIIDDWSFVMISEEQASCISFCCRLLLICLVQGSTIKINLPYS